MGEAERSGEVVVPEANVRLADQEVGATRSTRVAVAVEWIACGVRLASIGAVCDVVTDCQRSTTLERNSRADTVRDQCKATQFQKGDKSKKG